MSRLSAETKQAIIDKLLARDGRKVREIAELYNTGYSTLQKWFRKIRKGAIGVLQFSENHLLIFLYKSHNH